MDKDVVIIGGGLAGTTAALTASLRGARVMMLTSNPGATAMFSGVFDVSQNPLLPPSLNHIKRTPLIDDITAMVEQNPHHPYGAISNYAHTHVTDHAAQSLKDAFAILKQALAPAGLLIGGDLERQLLIGTGAGTARVSRVALSSIENGDFLSMRKASLHVVGISGLPEFNAPYIARSIRFLMDQIQPGAVATATSAVIGFPGHENTVNLTTAALASLLDSPENVSAIADRIRNALPRGTTHMAFPPMLGLREHPTTLDTLEKMIETPIFELASVQPGVPGLRLQRALDASMHIAGVERVVGRVTHVTANAGVVRSIAYQPEHGNESTVSCERYILATGRFISGGLEHRENLREPVFDLPVFWKTKQVRGALMSTLVTPVISDKQPVFSCGVRVDSRMYPLNERSEPVFSNLSAAGSVIGGYDALRDRCGAGVAVVTGHLAGIEASREIKNSK
jgi:glycerol-3-phosphate dehydrogenase subunit B